MVFSGVRSCTWQYSGTVVRHGPAPVTHPAGAEPSHPNTKGKALTDNPPTDTGPDEPDEEPSHLTFLDGTPMLRLSEVTDDG